MYVNGSNLYAATDRGLSISTNSGTSFTNYTTTNGLGGDMVQGVYAVGSTIYAATEGGISIYTDSSGSSPAADESYAPIIQQFGRPAVGTCNAAEPQYLIQQGFPSGGWGESWSYWIHGSKGGDVCTRMVVYSSSESKWIIH